MSNIGKFKYVCADCGKAKMLRMWEFTAKTKRPHCAGCGGTFLQPATHNSAVDFHRRSVAGNVVEQVGKSHRAVLGSDQEFAYQGTKLAVGSKAGKHTKSLRKDEKPVVGTGVISAPPAEPAARDFTIDITVAPIGSAKKRNATNLETGGQP